MNFIDWLKSIWEALNPLVVVMSYEGGVRWTLGRNPKGLKPGVHLKIWPLQDIETVPVVDTFMKLPTQSVITKDGKLVCFNVVICHRIFDPVKYFCEVVDFEEASEDLSMAHLATRVREETYEALTGDGGLKALESSLKNTLTTRLKDWGSEIKLAGFTNFTYVPWQVRLFGVNDE